MSKLYNCEDSFKVGNKGEKDIFNWLLKLTNWPEQGDKVIQVIDKRNDITFRKKDIDYQVVIEKEYEPNQIINVEIKTDTYETGNICFEIISSQETGSLGCMLKTKSDKILYYFPNWKKLYILDTTMYRAWCLKNIAKHNFVFERETRTMRSNGGAYTSLSVYFKLKDIEKLSFCKVYNIG